MVIPIIEYCCILWSPYNNIGKIREIESLQRSFTYRIEGMRELNYWQRLEKLNLYSLERRRERFMIIYVWKILCGLAPNLSSSTCRVEAFLNPRRGLLCRVPPLTSRETPAHISTLRENSFAVMGPRLFNCVKREVREYNGEFDGFKRRLDKFLRTIPDKPSLPHYVQTARSNSIIDQVCQMRLDR